MRARRGEMWALLAALSFVAFELTQRYAAPAVDPTAGALVRTLPLALAAWAYLLVRRERLLPAGTPLPVILALIAIGAFDFVIGNSLKLLAFQTGGIAISLPLLEAGNLLGAAGLAAVLLVRQPLTARLGLGLGIMVVGGAALTLGSQVLPGWGIAVPASLGAGLSFALSLVLTAYVFSHQVRLAPMLAVAATAGLVILTVVIMPSGLMTLGAIRGSDLVALLGSGLLNGLALFCLSRAVSYIAVGQANAISATNSAVAAALGAIIFGENPGALGWLGMAAVFAGAFVARSSLREQDGDAPAGATKVQET